MSAALLLSADQGAAERAPGKGGVALELAGRGLDVEGEGEELALRARAEVGDCHKELGERKLPQVEGTPLLAGTAGRHMAALEDAVHERRVPDPEVGAYLRHGTKRPRLS